MRRIVTAILLVMLVSLTGCIAKEEETVCAFTYNGIRMVPGEGHTNLIFDVALPLELRGQEAAIRSGLEKALSSLDGKTYHCVITFDMAPAQ